MLRKLLRLQELDLKIDALRAREREIPKQKGKFDIHRDRLKTELAQSEQRVKNLVLEQRDCEKDIQGKQDQIRKYDTQLLAVKKNEEYQALLHEMEILKKQISVREERIIAIMMEMEDLQGRHEEDKKRIANEVKGIDAECAKIDAELGEAVKEREQLEASRTPMAAEIDANLLARYVRTRRAKGAGAAIVPLQGNSCSGCHMYITPQIVNEILSGEKFHACSHCGRLLFEPANLVAAERADAGQ